MSEHHLDRAPPVWLLKRRSQRLAAGPREAARDKTSLRVEEGGEFLRALPSEECSPCLCFPSVIIPHVFVLRRVGIKMMLAPGSLSVAKQPADDIPLRPSDVAAVESPVFEQVLDIDSPDES